MSATIRKTTPLFILYFALKSSPGETVVSPQIKRLTLLKKKEIIFRRIFRQLQRRGIRGSPLIGGNGLIRNPINPAVGTLKFNERREIGSVDINIVGIMNH